MTIIAWDGMSMAGDRAMWNGSVCQPVRKVFRLEHSHVAYLKAPVLVGLTGSASFAHRVMNWIETGGEKPACPDSEKGTDSVLVVDARKRIFRLDALTLAPTAVDARRTAFGATVGMVGAICAMEAGASAHRAVELVIKYTDIAGLGVDVVRL